MWRMGLRSICSCSSAHLKAALTARIKFRRWFWLIGRSVSDVRYSLVPLTRRLRRLRRRVSIHWVNVVGPEASHQHFALGIMQEGDEEIDRIEIEVEGSRGGVWYGGTP